MREAVDSRRCGVAARESAVASSEVVSDQCLLAPGRTPSARQQPPGIRRVVRSLLTAVIDSRGPAPDALLVSDRATAAGETTPGRRH